MRARCLLAAAALATAACRGSGSPVEPWVAPPGGDLRLTIDQVVAVRVPGAVAVASFTVRNVGDAFLSVPRCSDGISWTLQKLDGPFPGSSSNELSTEICQANLRMAPLILEAGDAARGSVFVPAPGRYQLFVRYAHAIDSHTAARVAMSAPFGAP